MIDELSVSQLQDYISRNKRHKAYKKTVEIMNRLMVHANGDMPRDLIRQRRPSESENVKAYREKIYVPITKSTVSKIITSLAKIRKSEDWGIKYDATKAPARIPKNETLEAYCEKYFPYFGSLTNWAFNVCLRLYVLDPNALIAVFPLDTLIPENEYLEPFPVIYTSDLVLDFVPDDYAVILSTDKATYTDKGQQFDDGHIYYIFTSTRIQRYEQINVDKDYRLALDYEHGLGFLPVFKTAGLFSQSMDKTFIFESRIDGARPWLDEAVREYSDLQAEVVQHIHSEKWVYASQECAKCNGAGRVLVEGQQVYTDCNACKGQGRYVPTSPYENYVVRAPLVGEQSAIIPPAGYIQKQVEIVTIQDERINAHLYRALAAINMEFLAQTPLNQSGTAKEVDRDELNNFVSAIAADMVNILNKIYFIIAEYRYMLVAPDADERNGMLPQIPIPQQFDLLSPTYLVEELGKAKNMNLSPVLQNALMLEFAVKKFNNEPKVRDELQLSLSLDPFPGADETDKTVQLQNGGITKEDYIISCNIYQFVRRALDEYTAQNKDFTLLDFETQKKVIQGYVAEIVTNFEKVTTQSSTDTGIPVAEKELEMGDGE